VSAPVLYVIALFRVVAPFVGFFYPLAPVWASVSKDDVRRELAEMKESAIEVVAKDGG
jgi:hypothetical protein